MTCPCPCRREVKPGKRYASRGCFLRAMSKEELRARSQKALRTQWGSVRRSKEWREGRRAGYMAAFRYWRAWALREIAKRKAAA